jgi:glycine/D-amino acid oxidase-like deaminating enzyme
MKVLICGGGVIGAATALFLSRRGAEVVVVERTGIACAASGKSGGFLALDWCDGTPLQALARRSFELHARLAEEVPGGWGYRRLTTYGGVAGPGAAGGGGQGLPWLSDRVSLAQRLGGPETTAQVHPGRFTEALMRAAEANGAEVRIGAVTDLLRGPGDRRVRGAIVDGGPVEADAVVIAMGPWSRLAAAWLPLPPVYGLKGHSIVFETGGEVPAEALFLEHRGAGRHAASPEVYPRADGTTYVCAISSETPVPLDPAGVVPDPGAIERLEAICGELSPVLARSRILARQACHRPVTPDGLPLMGRVPGLGGAYVATGHSVWGILNAPASGEAMAGLILDGATQVDLSPFDPGRMLPAA